MARWSPTTGPGHRSTALRVQLIIFMSISPVVGCWISQFTVSINPIWARDWPVQLRSIPAMTSGGLSSHRNCAISTNPGGGVRAWLSDFAGCDTTSQVGVVCEVIWAVVTVGGTGHLLPLATNRDLLRCAQWLLLWLWSYWAGSAGQGEVISTQLEGKASLRTSSSVKETISSIAWQSSTMLSATWWGLLGTGSWAFSAQYWRTLVYVRVFCGCTSW